MTYRLIEWHGEIYVVLGISYDTKYDPPDVFYAVPVQETLIRSIMLQTIRTIPFSEATEITDEARIRAIWILYGR
jgi:hypothetical protein